MTKLLDDLRPLVADAVRGPEVQLRLATEVEGLIGDLSTAEFDPSTVFSADELLRRVTAYQERSADLAQALALLGYWAPPAVGQIASRTIARVATGRDRREGLVPWLKLYAYPAGLLFYAFGLAATAAQRWDNLGILFRQQMQDRLGHWVSAPSELHNVAVLDHQLAQALPEMQRNHTPSSDWLFGVVQPWLAALISPGPAFEREFDRFEFLVGLAYSKTVPHGWAPTGRFVWRGRYGDGLAAEMLAEIEHDPSGSPLVGSLFASIAELTETAKRYGDFVAKASGNIF